jgi:GTP:adenosylcobinamide-phosphate guanylyltransferase
VSWDALLLAAGRGPDDPMAKAYGVTHKCLVKVGGKPMLARVVENLLAAPEIATISISIEDAAIARKALGDSYGKVMIVPSRSSPPASIRAVLETRSPIFVTTADHPLLTGEMISHFLVHAGSKDADMAVGLATAETILAAYPEAKRTFLPLGRSRVSGCNLFAFNSKRAFAALDFWQRLEQMRKRPLKLIGAFGPGAIAQFVFGGFNLDSAFRAASRRLGLKACPVLMPFAEAAIDVDKPADKQLAEAILARRHQVETR